MSNVAVVGAGPAGIAASVQLVRSGIDVRVYEHNRVGGTLRNAGWVENYPGFPGGIGGRHLAKLMEEHFYQYVSSVHTGAVEMVKRTDTGYLVNEEAFQGVILCTGTASKRAGFPGENDLHKEGLLFYGLEEWHGPKEIGIVGGGEASIDMALGLSEAGLGPTIVHRSEPRGIKSLMDMALDDERISWEKGVVQGARIQGGKAVLALEDHELAFDIIIVAVGRERHIPELVGIDPANPPEGFLIAGDAARGMLGQAAMAVGDGVEAAMRMGRYLRSIG